MFSADEARDWRRALYGSFFDESLLVSKAAAPAPRTPRKLRPVTIAAPPRNRMRLPVESRAR